MVSKFVLLILSMTYGGSHCQNHPIVVVEGHNFNTAITCDLEQLHPLYWNINGMVYDLSNIPDLFIVQHSSGALTIPEVDRRMDGWTFQCFTIGENSNYGGTSILNVTIYGEFGALYHVKSPNCKIVLFNRTFSTLMFKHECMYIATPLPRI